MVNASRTRIALSPVPQNHSGPQASAAGPSKVGRSARLVTDVDNTRHSGLRARMAKASSALLQSPSFSSHASCFIELPLITASPFDTMPLPQARAGLKRKKGTNGQLGRGGPMDRHSAASSETLGTAASNDVRRTSSSTLRIRRNKDLNIVTSPHLPRDKPSSSASDLSDWSSVLSVSPTTSRAPSSRMEDASTVLQTRPGIQTRRSSRNSLHRTLNGMTLEDELPIGLGLGKASRSQSRSMSRQSSNHTAGSTVERTSRASSHRFLRSEAAADSDPSSEGSADMGDEEAEHARLISTAPTWQLHRLRRDELIQLCFTSGAWEVTPTEDERELLTKQDLVNQIITCRSRLDRSRSSSRQASASSHRQSSMRRGSSRTYDQRSDDILTEDGAESDALWMGSSTRKPSRRFPRGQQVASPSNSADDREDDLTDASNEAGGEETEAEPRHSLTRRRSQGRPAHVRGNAQNGATLRRMDSGTFDDFEPSKAKQAPRRPLRDLNTLRGATARRRRVVNGMEALSGSTSSSLFGGRSSRASNTSQSPFKHKHQLNMFVAASPIKTRSRAARLTAGLPARRARGPGAADTAALDPMATPKLGNRRAQGTRKAVKFNAASPSKGHAQDEDEWMEDHSSDSDAVAAALQAEPVSMAQVRDRTDSRKTLRTRRSTAGSDTSLTSHQPRSRSASLEAPSDDAHGALHDDDDADMASDDDGPTPTKFRKLRNGKMRLIATSSSGDGESREIAHSLTDDVDMDSASELTDIASSRGSSDQGRDGHTESPESDASASASIEDAMTQPSFASLSRLRKSELEQLCRLREIGIDEDDKKANLIKKLLDCHQLTQLEGVDCVAEAEQGDDADGMQSDNSGVTALAEDDPEQTRQRTPTRRRTTRAASNTHPETTDSDQPLLLRARGKLVSSEKLPTPPLTLRNEEAQPPQVGDGVDELNGLDLESLNLTDKEIAPSKLEKLEKIGSGGFKDVYVGKYRISKTRVNKVAIADIRDQLTEMDIKELSLLRDLRHENIVRFIGVSIPEDPRHVPCMIVSELCSNGDLFDYIRNTTAPSDAEVFRILLETARGLEYLHTRTPAIIHRDCKSTNVLITRRKTAKINDFGLARVKNTSRSMMRSLVGTVNWQAVELWTPKPHYNEKVDVWSAAMTFWEALQWHQPEKKYPFQGMNEHQIYQDVGQKKQRPYTGFIRRQFGGEIVDLLDRMWDHTPKNRPTMTEVCTELESLIEMKKETAAAGSSTRSGKA